MMDTKRHRHKDPASDFWADAAVFDIPALNYLRTSSIRAMGPGSKCSFLIRRQRARCRRVLSGEFGAVAKALKVNPTNCSIDLRAHPDSDSPICDNRTATVHRG